MDIDLKGIFSAVAPWIGTALGGPLGGMAISAAADALGLSEKTEQAIKGALTGATPEQMLALKNADQDFSVKMQELGFQNTQAIEKIAADDRNSAREREKAVKDNTPKILAYAITVGFFGVLMVLMFGKVPDSSKDILYIMLGTLGTAWTGVISYYFGSTAGSAEKSRLLAQSQPPK